MITAKIRDIKWIHYYEDKLTVANQRGYETVKELIIDQWPKTPSVEIAKWFGVCPESVRKWARRLKLPKPHYDQNGWKKYKTTKPGPPCPVCGGVEYYSNSQHRCAICQRNRCREYAKRRKRVPNKKRTLQTKEQRYETYVGVKSI